MFHPLHIEKDVAVPMRDGSELVANVFRPVAAGRIQRVKSASEGCVTDE